MRFVFAFCICCLTLLLSQPGQAAMRVALLQDQENDHGFTASIRDELTKAKADLGIEFQVITATDEVQQEEAFKKAATAGFDLVLVATPPFHELLLNNAGNYRKQRFVCLDESIKAPNIVSVLFADAQAAYLAGAAAAMFTTAKNVPGVNAEAIVGFVGSMDTPLQRYELEAFLAGARIINPEVRVLTAFTGSATDKGKGKAAALDLYGRGADVLLHCAGASGLGVLEAAKEQKRYAIGMGQDQHALAPGHVLLSQGKDGGKVVREILTATMTDKFPGGQVLEKGMKDGSVGIVGLEHPRSTLGAAFPAEIPQRLQELEYEIRRGSIPLNVPKKKGLCDCL